MMDLTMNFDTDECLVTAMFDKGNRNDTMEAIDHIIPFLKGDADMIGLVCNTLRKLLCMSDEGYETFLMDLEDYKSELEDIKLGIGDNVIEAKLSDLGVTFDNEDLVDEAI